MKNIIIGLLAIGIIALVVIVVTSNNNQDQQQDSLGALIQNMSQPDQDTVENEDTSSQDDLSEEIENEDQMMTILLPELVFEGEGWDIEYTPVEVPYSLGVMNAAYEAFFDQHNNEYYGLSYQGVELDGSTAILSLGGSYISSGTMTRLEVRSEINAVAFQFDTVNTLEVYLNGDMWDWCDYDQAGPHEGPCQSGPQFWIDAK